MPVDTLIRILDDNEVEYAMTRYSPAYTAQKIAAAAHICGRELAIPVIRNFSQ